MILSAKACAQQRTYLGELPVGERARLHAHILRSFLAYRRNTDMSDG